MVREVRQSDGSMFPTVAMPYRFSETPIEVGPTPYLGEHNEEVLRSLLGYDRTRIDDLVARGLLSHEAARAPGQVAS